MKLRYFICALLNLEFYVLIRAFKYEEITNEIFPLGEDIGIIAAFGHFNSDEFTDIVTIQNSNKLKLLIGSENQPYFESFLNCTFESVIVSVVPGDYNGDLILDLLITLYRTNNLNDVRILWGNNYTIDCKSNTSILVSNHPFVVDFNGDMVPDILGENEKGERYVWISSTEKKFTPYNISHIASQKILRPHSSGLFDLNNDMAPDILIMGDTNIEKWYNTGKDFIKNDTDYISYPPHTAHKWQSSFVDLNLNGKLDHIMPVCYDVKCKSSAILIWNDNLSQWDTLLDNFKHPRDNIIWGFKIPGGSTLEKAALPVTLRAGDVDMDGYPDLVMVLQSKEKESDIKTVILKNVQCHNCIAGRQVEIEWYVPGLEDITNIQIATFFDIFEDGTLDILASTKNTNGEWKIHALRNTEIFDSCFLKVLVLSGLCYQNCSMEPYGVNQPGPMVRYNMTTQEGRPLVSTSVQLSQSVHFSLQLPYSLFGLGQTPNFIDLLTVSVPSSFNQSVHKREWIQIIPNSQIVIIPHPPFDEKKWVKKLFVTPSHLVLLTCISLIGTCTFIALLVALLHWKEKREDKKEKMQDAYRFHFDAM